MSRIMPEKGHKKFDTFKVNDDGARAATANQTAIGNIKRKDGSDKKWVKKTLSCQQEVLIECITGEIYRYLIGPKQPKIRTGEEGDNPNPESNTVLSEFVPYRSLRDIFGIANSPKYDMTLFKQCFNDQIDGFMMVIFSSMMLEENDLSDMNYGLSIYKDGVFEKYGEFIKIDHGQSLNSMRIAVSGSFSRPAFGSHDFKFYPPIQQPINANLPSANTLALDTRDKAARESTFKVFKTTQYDISPSYLDHIITDFLDGRIDKNYIIDNPQNSFRPSIFPLYDGRLLSLIESSKTKYGKFEASKYRAIAKIVFTTDALYSRIAALATNPSSLRNKQQEIRQKILTKKKNLVTAISTDLDFCRYCYDHKANIEQDILDSKNRMALSRKGEVSARYSSLGQEECIDSGLLNEILVFGEAYSLKRVCNSAINFIDSTATFILANTDKFKALGLGGTNIKLNGRSLILPENIVAILYSISNYQRSSDTRLCRTMQDLIYIFEKTTTTKSFFRANFTQAFYNERLLELQRIFNSEAIEWQRFSLAYTNGKKERYFNLLES